MLDTAIVCQAYGTDPTGKLPSEMDKDVCFEAVSLAIWNQIETIIVQGGFSFQGGPKEAELMARRLQNGPWKPSRIIEEKESLNTLEGAKAILQIAKRERLEELYIIAQSFHIRRVAFTYRWVFRRSGIELRFSEAHTKFGPNSQKRLTSWWRWWPWEIAATIGTPIYIFLNK